MGRQLTTRQWSTYKSAYPEEARSSRKVILDHDSNVFAPKKKKDKKRQYSKEFQEIIDWCIEILEGDFYVEIRRYRVGGSMRVFYFVDDGDAVIFKLTWMK